jgi:DNA polymerase-1
LIDSSPYEADDIIATLATRHRRARERVIIASDDKDLGCLVRGKKVIQHRFCDSRNSPPLDEDAIYKRWGVSPYLVSDVLALCGDSVDEVKGLVGVGPISAASAILKHGSVERVALAAADNSKRWIQRAAGVISIGSMTSLTRLIDDVDVCCTVRQRPHDWPARVVCFLLKLEAVSTARRIAQRYKIPVPRKLIPPRASWPIPSRLFP